MRLAKVENIDTGVEFLVVPQVYEDFKTTFLFKGWVDEEVGIKKRDVATTDIHQMNKTALLEEATKLGIQVSDKMTVNKIKEAILDHKASIPDKVEAVMEEVEEIIQEVKKTKKGK